MALGEAEALAEAGAVADDPPLEFAARGVVLTLGTDDVAFFVGAFVGEALTVGAGLGFVGSADGVRWLVLDCHAKATNPPLGTFNPSTPTLEYTQCPDVPSDQYSPQ